MRTGTVRFFDTSRGYGFITNDEGGNDIFVHASAVDAAGLGTLEKDQRLTYDVENAVSGNVGAVNLQAAPAGTPLRAKGDIASAN